MLERDKAGAGNSDCTDNVFPLQEHEQSANHDHAHHDAHQSKEPVGEYAPLRRWSLRIERYGSRSAERLRQPGEHHKVGVKGYTLQLTDAKRRQSELMLQAAKLSFNGCAATVKIAPPLCFARDERVAAVGFDPGGFRLTLPGRAAPLGRVAFEVPPANVQRPCGRWSASHTAESTLGHI
jgi:hypothetical protein